jgi:hypothetical protein
MAALLRPPPAGDKSTRKVVKKRANQRAALISRDFNELRPLASERRIAGHAEVFGVGMGLCIGQDRAWHDRATALGTEGARKDVRHWGILQTQTPICH